MTKKLLSQADHLAHSASKLLGSDYKKTLRYYNQALKIYLEYENFSDAATCFNNIGLIYLSLKKYSKALNFFKSALDLNNTYNDTLGYALTLVKIGKVYKEQGKYTDALDYFKKALPILNDDDWCKNEGEYILQEVNNFINFIANYNSD